MWYGGAHVKGKRLALGMDGWMDMNGPAQALSPLQQQQQSLLIGVCMLTVVYHGARSPGPPPIDGVPSFFIFGS